MISIRALLLSALALVVAGCQSGITPNYYRLESLESLGQVGPGPSLGLTPVAIPEYLSRSGLVRDTSGLVVDVSDTERWAEPLESGIARVMALNLARAIPTADLRPYPWNSKRKPDISLRLKVTELQALPGRATLIAEAQLLHRDGGYINELLSLDSPLPNPATGSDIAGAYSRLLADLSVRLAETIRSHPFNAEPAN